MCFKTIQSREFQHFVVSEICDFYKYMIEYVEYVVKTCSSSIMVWILKWDKSFIHLTSCHLFTLREVIFAGRKFRKFRSNSRKLIPFFDPQKCRFAQINSRENFQNRWFAKINAREIFRELRKCLVSVWYSVFWIRSSRDHRLFCHLYK